MSAAVLHSLIAAIARHAEVHAGTLPAAIRTSSVVRDMLVDDINATRFRADPAAPQLSGLTDEVRVLSVPVTADDKLAPWVLE